MKSEQDPAHILPPLYVIFTLIGASAAGADGTLGPCVTVSRGAINGVCLERNGHHLVIYGDPQEHWKAKLCQLDKN